jgi:hypothetical protein
MESSDTGTDFAYPQQTNPTLVIQSADATAPTGRLTLTHDQTNAVIDSGKGSIQFATQTSHAAYTESCQTATDDFDIDWSNGNIVFLDIADNDCDQAANDVNEPTNPVEGASYVIHIQQSADADIVLTWNAVFLWPGGTAPVLTATASARDVVSCLYSDAVYLCSFAQAYATP